MESVGTFNLFIIEMANLVGPITTNVSGCISIASPSHNHKIGRHQMAMIGIGMSTLTPQCGLVPIEQYNATQIIVKAYLLAFREIRRFSRNIGDM